MATELQERVWKKLKQIPQGKVVSYAELARAVGNAQAVRAVASAVGKNTKLITIPCHRVVRSDRSVGKYAKGEKKKIALLKKEGVRITDGKVDRESFVNL